jgi:hypothetical protein
MAYTWQKCVQGEMGDILSHSQLQLVMYKLIAFRRSWKL